MTPCRRPRTQAAKGGQFSGSGVDRALAAAAPRHYETAPTLVMTTTSDMFDTMSVFLYNRDVKDSLPREAVVSYEEKGIWAYLIAVAGSYAVYVVIIVGRLATTPVSQVHYAATLLWTTVASTAASVAVR